jgi:hypothetical protein
MRNAQAFTVLVAHPEEKRHLRYVGVDGRIY